MSKSPLTWLVPACGGKFSGRVTFVSPLERSRPDNARSLKGMGVSPEKNILVLPTWAPPCHHGVAYCSSMGQFSGSMLVCRKVDGGSIIE